MKTKAYRMNINQFQKIILKTNCYMQIWTPKEIGKAVAICTNNIDLSENLNNGVEEVETKNNEQLENGQIIIIEDL